VLGHLQVNKLFTITVEKRNIYICLLRGYCIFVVYMFLFSTVIVNSLLT